MEHSLFEAIAQAVAELNREAERVAHGKRCLESIPTGDLGLILQNARTGAEQLKRIRFSDVPEVHGNQYLADPRFIEAVKTVMHHREGKVA